VGTRSTKPWISVLALLNTLAIAYLAYVQGPVEVKKVELIAVQSQVQQANADISELNKAIKDASEQFRKFRVGSTGTTDEGQKVCMVLKGNKWRDGMIVPMDWTINLCQDYQRKTGGDAFQLGCIYPSGIVIAHENGTTPDRDCGWK
jgi:archaellum component FlaF (FlaF/FlaG flagellin family)